MPARPAAANRRVPRSLAGLGSLPQGKVARRILFVLVQIHPRPVFHAAQVFLAQLPVFRKRCQPEVPAPVLGLVGGAGCGQFLHQLHHARNVLGGPRDLLRPLDAEGIEVLEKSLDKGRRVLADRDACLDVHCE